MGTQGDAITSAYRELALGLQELAEFAARTEFARPGASAEPEPAPLSPEAPAARRVLAEVPFLAAVTAAAAVASPVVFTVAFHLFPPARPALGG